MRAADVRTYDSVLYSVLLVGLLSQPSRLIINWRQSLLLPLTQTLSSFTNTSDLWFTGSPDSLGKPD